MNGRGWKCLPGMWILVFLLTQHLLGAPDPYVILDKCIAAQGGLAKMRSQRTMHSVGKLVILGAGLEGTIETWSETPVKMRQEVDLKVLKQIQGDNGDQAWQEDQNGKLQIYRDSATLKDRQLRMLTARFEHLQRRSRFFTVTYDHLDTAAGATCHVVRFANTIDSTVTYSFYDTVLYREVKTIVIKPTGESQMVNRDFREVDGTALPFEIETLDLPSGQRSLMKMTSIDVNGTMDTTVFDPPAEQRHDFRFPTGKSTVEVPFKFIELHIFLPLTINGKTKLWVLDSGAEASVIASSFARELGLRLEGKMAGLGAGATVEVSFTTLPPFEIGGLAFDSQKVAAIGLDDIARKVMGVDIGGILGYDFLSRLVTKIDYAGQTLTFIDEDSFAYSGNGVTLQTPLTQSKMFHVPMTVDGKHSGRWNLDLGAGGLSFQYPYAKEHGLLNRPALAYYGFGAGGLFETKESQFDSVTFAGFTISKPIVSIPTQGGKGAFSTSELVGNAGNALFRHFNLYLDYKRGQIIVEKGKDFETTFPFDRSGLQLSMTDEGTIRVTAVPAGTPAADAGMKVDDEILAVDGRPIDSIGGLNGMRELFRAQVGTSYRLTCRHRNQTGDVTLKLRELF